MVLAALLPGRWPRGGYALFTAVVAGVAGDVHGAAVERRAGRRPQEPRRRRARAGRLLALRHLRHLRGRAGVGAVPGRLPPPRRPRRRRGLRVDADVRGGRRDHGVGQRSHRALPRLRGALAGALRHGRQPAPPPREPGVRAQVLHPGRLLVRLPALRHRPRLRRHRVDEPRADRRLPGRERAAARTGCCWPASRCCSWDWPSRWRRSRSTPGRPTSTRARRRRSPGSWPRRPRPPRSPRCCGWSSSAWLRTSRTGSR